jgi:tetrahydromethanopterin S-methyltransferase subunit A
VTVLALPTQLYFTNYTLLSNHNFRFTIRTPWTNTPWQVLTATNLATAYTNWVPIYTNITGVRGLLNYTDLLASNYVNRYYRLEFP